MRLQLYEEERPYRELDRPRGGRRERGGPVMSQPFKNLLLRGPPGCGKTTCVRRLAERLGDLRLAGFYTAEIREGGNRVGFEAVRLSTGRHAVLAHVRSKSRHRVGRYGVEPAALAQLV